MNDDVLARLAAANPVPHDRPLRLPQPLRVRRAGIALALAAAVAIPATAFAGRLGDLLGLSNEGMPVSTDSVLPGQSRLDQAMAELGVGSTMQSLGTLDGVAFYATRNADGHFCLAIDHVAAQYEKGFGCDLNADGFPSASAQVLAFPPVERLQGVAADGVATVALLDAQGNVLVSTPVVNNLFVSNEPIPSGEAAALETLDANGNVTSTRPLPSRSEGPAGPNG